MEIRGRSCRPASVSFALRRSGPDRCPFVAHALTNTCVPPGPEASFRGHVYFCACTRSMTHRSPTSSDQMKYRNLPSAAILPQRAPRRPDKFVSRRSWVPSSAIETATLAASLMTIVKMDFPSGIHCANAPPSLRTFTGGVASDAGTTQIFSKLGSPAGPAPESAPYKRRLSIGENEGAEARALLITCAGPPSAGEIRMPLPPP